LEYKREDGSGESAELETKTFLFHDLLHYSLESTANLSGGFFGLLNSGKTYAELSGKMDSEPEYDTIEIRHIEQAVGTLTGLSKGSGTPHEAIESLRNILSAYGEEMSPWLTAETLTKALERYRQVLGHWNSLKFGETLELHFEPK
jgi:hypothetical protein